MDYKEEDILAKFIVDFFPSYSPCPVPNDIELIGDKLCNCDLTKDSVYAVIQAEGEL